MGPTLKSTKRSCTTFTTSGDDIGQICQCELLIKDGFIPQVAAIGKLFEGTITLHNMVDVVKVMVEKVRDDEVHVPLSTNEVSTMVKAL